MTTWNHRVVEHEDGDSPWLAVAEVFYDESGAPIGYAETCVGSETLDGLKEVLERMTKALEHPVLHAKTDFTNKWGDDDEEV